MSKSFFSVDKGLRLRPQSSFPSDPVDGDIINKSNRFYKWNAVSSAWDLIVTPASADTLTGKVYSGGTASDTNKTILAADTLANINTNVTKTKGTMVFADDLQKPVICGANGQAFTPIGGGLDPVYLDTTGTTAANGKNYLVKTSSADITLNVPAGGTTMMQFGFKDDGDFTAYKLILAPAAAVSIYVAHLNATITGASEVLNIDVKGASGQLDWDVTNSRWVLSLGGYSGLSTLGGGGGGLVVTPLTVTSGTGALSISPVESGKHYIIDMSAATDDRTVVLPAGSTANNLKISVIKASSLYKLTISCNGAETITYAGSTDTTLIIPKGCESWVEFCWNSAGWSAEDSSNPSSVVVSYSATTKRTKQVNLTVTGNNGWNPLRCKGLAYADSNGVWRLIFNIEGQVTASSTTVSLLVSGILWVNAGSIYQSCSAFGDATVPAVAILTPATNQLDLYMRESGVTGSFRCSGDVELDSKPTWADANMEGVIAPDIYIPFGQTGMPGEVMESSVTGSAANTVDGVYKRMTTLTLTAGKWLISGSVYLQASGPISSSKINLTTTDGASAGVSGKSTFYASPFANGAGQAIVPPYLVTIPVGSSVPYYLNIQVNGTSISNDLNGAYMLATRLAP